MLEKVGEKGKKADRNASNGTIFGPIRPCRQTQTRGGKKLSRSRCCENEGGGGTKKGLNIETKYGHYSESKWNTIEKAPVY